MRAADLADDLRHGDTGETYFGLAAEYAAMGRDAERRALWHAERGDLFVAYDEAADARFALGHMAVAICAWLATIAKQADFDRRMRFDCGSTDGEQLSLDAEPEGPFPCPGCYAFPGEPHPPYCPDAAMANEDALEDYAMGEAGSVSDTESPDAGEESGR